MDARAPFPFQNIIKADGRVSASLTMPKAYPFFEGHFVGDPILPAVCIIDASMELLTHQVSGLLPEAAQLKRCRFSSKIRPEETVTIEGNEYAPKQWKFIWLGSQSQKPVAQVHVQL